MPRTSVIATVDSTAVAAPLEQAAKAGKAVFHVLRHDGSTRRMQYLAPRTPARRTAEKVVAMRGKRVPMRDIALSMHVSIPTVRRMINNLELSQHIERGDLRYTVVMADQEGSASPPD